MDTLIAAFFIVLAFKIISGLISWRRTRSSSDLNGMKGVPLEFKGEGPARWIHWEETLKFKRFVFREGLFYFGARLPGFDGKNDSCLIDPALPLDLELIAENTNPQGDLRYDTLSPSERTAYMHWLEDGRSGLGPNTSTYAALYVFGLERRIAADGARGELSKTEREKIVSELLRLHDAYGFDNNLRAVIQNVLALEWVIYGDHDEVPEFLNFEEGTAAEIFPAIIARLSAVGRPIPEERALQWVILREFQKSPVHRVRKSEEYKELFRAHYKEKYGEGMKIHPSRKPLIIHYRPANPSLGESRSILIQRLPDPFLISTPLSRIDALAEECEASLASRRVAEYDDRGLAAGMGQE